MKTISIDKGIFKSILGFSLPYLLSYFLQTLYGMADLFIIGQFNGVESTTAVSIGSQVMHMLTVIIVGLAMGSTVTIAQAIGAERKEDASDAVGNTVFLFSAFALLLTAVLLFFVNSVVSVMSTPVEAVEGTTTYLTICFIGIPFITAYNVICSVFRGMGDSKSPMYFVAVACAANIALDYLFIGAFQMGAAGAALGTTVSQAISVVISLAIIVRQKIGIKISTKNFKPKKGVMGMLLKIGMPVAFQDGFIQVSFLIITLFANQRGLNDSAAVGIVEKVIAILFLVPSSMLGAVSALAAQNIGAGRYDRARLIMKYAIVLAVSFGAVSTIAMQFGAEYAVAFFADSSEAVIIAGGQYMRGYVWDCVLAGIHFCFSGYFCACGNSEMSFLHNSISILCARIPLSYLAAKHFADTLFPMGLSPAAGSALSVLICIAVYIKICKKQIIEN